MSNRNPKTAHLKRHQFQSKGLGTVQGKAPIAIRLPQDVEFVLAEVNQALKKMNLSKADYLRASICDRLKADGIYPDAEGKFNRTNLEMLIETFKVES